MTVRDRSEVVRRRLLWTGVAAACGVCLLAMASCRRTTTVTTSGPDAKEECGTILESAVGMAQPLKLGLTTSIDGVVNRLNDWRLSCPDSKKTASQLDPDAEKLLAAILSKKELAAMRSDVYDERDARHVRNCLVFVRVAQSVTAAATSDLDQVVDVFYYVTRNVELVERKPGSAPLSEFRTLLFGQGTAADRAWVFAAILRQLKFSAVVISPRKGSAAKDGRFVVGVLLQGRIYLFDTHLGLPVPAPDDVRTTPLIRKPATLAQFIADPKIAASLSTGEFKYSLAAGDLKRPRVQLIGQRCQWSPRMKDLYLTGRARPESTTGNRGQAPNAELFEELGGNQGLIARTVEFGKGIVARDDVSIWPYPQRQMAAFANMNERQRSEMADLQRPFDVPRQLILVKDENTGKMVVAIDKKTGRPILGPPSRLQLKARIRQIMGEYDRAVTSYVSVQSQTNNTIGQHRELPVLEQITLRRARDDAGFWVGVCKLELEELETAVSRFSETVRQSPQWTRQAAFLLTLCEAKQNKFASARTDMETLIKRKPPQAHGYALLRQRWKSFGKTAPGKTPTKTAAPKKKSVAPNR
jgi:Transglutaminase-like superfamily